MKKLNKKALVKLQDGFISNCNGALEIAEKTQRALKALKKHKYKKAYRLIEDAFYEACGITLGADYFDGYIGELIEGKQCVEVDK